MYIYYHPFSLGTITLRPPLGSSVAVAMFGLLAAWVAQAVAIDVSVSPEGRIHKDPTR